MAGPGNRIKAWTRNATALRRVFTLASPSHSGEQNSPARARCKSHDIYLSLEMIQSGNIFRPLE